MEMLKEEIEKTKKEMMQAFNEIQMARTPYVLEAMVVNSKYTDEQRYAQCVLEMSIAYDNLRMAELHVEQKQIEIDEINSEGRKGEIEREIKAIEQEQTKRAMLGAAREFEFLYNLWIQFPKKYTRQELNDAQPLEFLRRIKMQELMDKNATGRVSVGNQEALRQIGLMPEQELDAIRSVEQRFLEIGDIKLSIVVPTEFKDEKLLCLQNLEFPSGVQVRIENCYGLPVADAYNKLFQNAINAKSDYILTVEDDTFPQPDALIKLLELIKKIPKCAVGAWYPKKEESMQGVHIIVKNGVRQQLDNDGLISEVYTLAMGCSLFPAEMFKNISYPWFKTTDALSQDSFFSQLARESGYKLLVDSSITCKHVDRISGKIYEVVK